MKKHMLALILEFAYVILTAGILFLNIVMFNNIRERMIAGAELFLLAIAALLMLKLKMKISENVTQHMGEKDKVDSDTFIPVSREIFERFSADKNLSAREIEVAWLLYLGYTNRQISEELFIAETTVKKHVTHIFEKSESTCRKNFRDNINQVNF